MKDMTNENEFKTPTLGEYLKGEEPAKEPETENNHISKEMDTNNAPVEQLDADATKNEAPVSEQAPVEAPAEDTVQAESDPTKSNTPDVKDGTTTSSEEELSEAEQRKHETEVYHSEVKRVLADPRYHAQSLPGGNGVIMNLTAAVRDGIELSTPSYNRAHGKDQERTAKSIEEIGLQHPLIVATSAMAEAAGMPLKRFDTDPNKDRPLGLSLTVGDGNGRARPLLKKPVEEWPDVYAVFPSLDANDQMDFKKVYVHINMNVSTWGGPDFLVLKVMEPDPHEAWTYMKKLQDDGYGHTASNVLTTLKKGNITKTQLTKVDLDEARLFERFESAKKVHTQLKATFGEDTDILKTKQVPEEMVDCLNELVEDGGLDKAVEKMIAFLKSLKSDEVASITGARGKAGASKHVVRVGLFHNLFTKYIDTHK